MIRLGLPRAARTLDLGAGVTVTVTPLTFALYRAAVAAAEDNARQVATEAGLITAAGGTIRDIPDPHDRQGIVGLRDQFMLQALARHAITGWTGVAAADGQPAAVTPAAVDALIRDFPLLASRLEVAYLAQIAELSAEGNGLGAAPNGTSAAAPTTAAAAGSPAGAVPMPSPAAEETLAPIG